MAAGTVSSASTISTWSSSATESFSFSHASDISAACICRSVSFFSSLFSSVWQGKYGFASLAGIWIQSEDGRRYVTVWDDEPVFTDRFVLALPKEAVNTENKEEKSEQVTERETESIHEKQTGISAR